MDNIRARVPLLAGAKARLHVEYLGFIVGPRCSDIAWKKPWQLYLSRFEQLIAAQRSASTLVPIYNMSVATTLSYIGQLYEMPSFVLGGEHHRLHKLFKLIPLSLPFAAFGFSAASWLAPGCFAWASDAGLVV